ncbi:MAG: hypothetical protein CMF80_08080 [Candidatus Marinimicrobia bacterium]|nr:hypothetical protein [Candidatus Neomarinimicrobiota bacterium]|tara:strand:- start:151 stop:1035 length:885 start_codon:yes stop_codon:yes gene_type:complete
MEVVSNKEKEEKEENEEKIVAFVQQETSENLPMGSGGGRWQAEQEEVEQEEEEKINVISMDTPLTDKDLWDNINSNPIKMDKIKKKMEFLLNEWGTSLPCNRFDVGNSIEFLISYFLESIGYTIQELPNARRIDLCINSVYPLSIKYSSTGDITLHNSNSCVNKDVKLTDLILLTTDEFYLITNKELELQNIDVEPYLKNPGDSLKLKRSFLTKLKKCGYPYRMDFKLNVDKQKCKNRLCSRTYYKCAMEEYAKKEEAEAARSSRCCDCRTVRAAGAGGGQCTICENSRVQNRG